MKAYAESTTVPVERSKAEIENLAQIVVAGGATVGSQIIPRLAEACQTGNLPPLLGSGGTP